jgi:hypothetical protein
MSYATTLASGDIAGEGAAFYSEKTKKPELNMPPP